jgi:dephospho-CoA kinase
MDAFMLGFAGGIASGKSAVSVAVAAALGWNRASFGDYLRGVARERGLAGSRENLQALGGMFAMDMRSFCASVLKGAQWKSGDPLVLDGIRHSEAVDALTMLVAPLRLVLVYLDVIPAIRQERFERKQDQYQRLDELEKHSTEIQVEKILRSRADLVVDSSGAVVEVAKEGLTRLGDMTN